MCKIIINIWIVVVFTVTVCFASTGKTNKILFDKNITIYIYINDVDNCIIKRLSMKVNLPKNEKLLKIFKHKALYQEYLIKETIKKGLHITPKQRKGYYQITIELKNQKTKNYLTFEYDFNKKYMYIDNKLNKSEEGKLILKYLQKNKIFSKINNHMGTTETPVKGVSAITVYLSPNNQYS